MRYLEMKVCTRLIVTLINESVRLLYSNFTTTTEENPVIYTEYDTNNNTLVIQPGSVFMLNKGGNFIIGIM